MNNENNLVNDTNNIQPTTPSVEPQVTPATVVAPEAPQTVATPVEPVKPVETVSTVTPETAAPTTPEAPHYSTPTLNINTNNERVFRGNTDVVKTDDSKNYNAIEEQLGTTTQSDSNTNQPQVANVAVSEVNNEVSKDNILSSITLEDDDDEQSGDAESVTFDYNEIYGNKEKTDEENDNKSNDNKEVFSATELNLQDRLTRQRTDLAPEFNLNELEGNENGSKTKAQDNVLSAKQQDRADTRRKLLFIGIIVLIIIIALEFVFPKFV